MTITQAELQRVLRYDMRTGIFTWLARDGVPKEWNTRWAGKAAGRLDSTGYVGIRIHYRRYLAHRLAWLYVTGEWPPEYMDHINGNPADNRIANLRPCSSVENAHNLKRSSRNTSGSTGVHWEKRGRKWLAFIRSNGRFINLGRFDAKEDAVAARAAGRARYQPFNVGREDWA